LRAELAEPRDQPRLAARHLEDPQGDLGRDLLPALARVLPEELDHLVARQVRDVERALDVERRAPRALDPEHGADADEREPVEEEALAVEVHRAERAHELVEEGWRKAVELVDEQDHRPVERSPFPCEEIDPSIPVTWRGRLEPEALSEQGRHGSEEDLLGGRVAKAALHVQGADREALAVPGPDLLDGPAHYPGHARPPGGPDSEEVSAL